MQILGEFYEQDVNGSESAGGEILYKVRKGVRALVFNWNGEIAMMFVSKDDYHKLPGGGVKRGEDLESALKREILEETGCEIKIKPKSVGMIIEYRESRNILQISYCYVAEVVGRPGEPSFTEREKEKGFELEWMKLDDAIEVMEKEKPDDYIGQFVKKRDLLFLHKAKGMIDR